MPSIAFRKQALAKQSSPEHLDQMLPITPRRAWLALGAVFAIFVCLAVWGVLGSVPTRVTGSGIFVREGGAYPIVALGEGTVTALHVTMGEKVEPGQTIAVLQLPALAVKLENSRARVDELERDHKIALEAEEKSLAASLEALTAQSETLKQSARDFDEQAESLAERNEIQLGLQSRGLISRSTLLATKASLAAARQNASSARVELSINENRRTETTNQIREKSEARRLRLADAKRELLEIEKQYDEATQVRSPVAGRIVEMQAELGGLVSRGESVVTVEDASANLVVLLFIPAGEGKKVQAGMSAQIAPSVAKREEFGFMKGTVRSISGLPVTEQAAQSFLHNSRLVNELFQRGNPILVTVVPVPDARTASGYAWSTSKGPPLEITSGTLVEGQIVVSRQRPITMVLPLSRKLFGLD